MQRNLFFFWSTVLLTPGVLFGKFLSESDYAAHISRFQKVVLFKNATEKKAFIKVLPKSGKIVGKGSHFIAVRPKGAHLQFRFLRAMAGLSTKFKVVDEKLITTRADSHSPKGLMQVVRTHDFELDSDEATYLGANPEDVCSKEGSLKCEDSLESPSQQEQFCHITAHCGAINPSWLRLATGADIIDKYIEDLWNKKGKDIQYLPKVAVIDTGFDKKGNEQNLDVPTRVEYFEAPNAGKASEDESGHGTAVAGVISGKRVGLTKFARLSIYRTTEPGAGKLTTISALASAIEAACKENDIVNVSMGTLADELSDEESPLEPTLRAAQEMGCLVIQSAGNHSAVVAHAGRRSSSQKVHALTPHGRLSFFSSLGRLGGFGQNIYSLVAEGTGRPPCCQTPSGKLRPNRGTSFAGPVVAAMAAQAIAVLNLKGKLPSRDSWVERYEAITSILHSTNTTSDPTLVPGLPPGDTEDPPNFFSVFPQIIESYDKACEKPLNCIQSKMSCEEKRACYFELARQLFCQHEGADLGKPFVDLLKSMGESELVQTGFGGFSKASKRVQELWPEFLDPKTKVVQKSKLIEAIDLLRGQLTDREAHPSLALQIRQVLGAEGIAEVLNHSELLSMGIPFSDFSKRDRERALREGTLESVADKIFNLITTLSENDKLALIAEMEGQSPKHWKGRHIAYPSLVLSDSLGFIASPSWRINSQALREACLRLNPQWTNGKLVGLSVQEVLDKPHTFERLISVYPADSTWEKEHAKYLNKIFSPLSSSNIHLVALGVASPTFSSKEPPYGDSHRYLDRNLSFVPQALSKEKLAFLKHVIESPIPEEIDRKDYSAILDRAAQHLMVEESGEWDPSYVKGPLVTHFLNNPFAVLPHNAASTWEAEPSRKQEVLLDTDLLFFEKFIDLQLSRGMVNLSGDNKNKRTTEGVDSGHEMKNILRAISRNRLYDTVAIKELLTREGKPNLNGLINLAVSNILKNPKVDATPEENPSLVTIQNLVDESDTFSDPTLKTQIQKLLQPLKDDLDKPNRTYPNRFRNALLKFYC